MKNTEERGEFSIKGFQPNKLIKQKEKVLFYEKLFKDLSCIVFVYDLFQNKLLWISDYHKKLFGYNIPPGDFKETEIKKFFHPDDIEVLSEANNFFKKGKKGNFTAIYRVLNAEGNFIWVYSSMKVFRKTKDEKSLEIVGFTTDFSIDFNYDKHLKEVFREKVRRKNSKEISCLSKRELQILKYFTKGFKTKEIAAELGISFHTVNNHRKNILKKLNIRNIASMVNFAVEHGLG